MNKTVDYYLAPSSPWTYLGHTRLTDIVAALGVNVRLLPVDLGGKVFPATGGLPLGQRSAQRQAYRLVELRRFSEHLNMPLNLHPKFFPVSADPAAKLIIAVQEKEGARAAMTLCGVILSAIWAREENIADPQVLGSALEAAKLSREYLEVSNEPWVQGIYDQNTIAAIEQGVFGSPTYIFNKEVFWGQDRLDFLKARISAS
jgi:carboxymethylenebutenolidase